MPEAIANAAPIHRRWFWVVTAAIASVFIAGALVAVRSSTGITDPFDLLPGSAVLWTLAFGAVGSLIAWNRPSNSIGWLMLVASLGAAIGFLAGNLFGFAVGPENLAQITESGLAPSDMRQVVPLSASVLAVTALTAWGLVETVFFLTLLLFPDGEPISTRWRWAARFVVGYLIVFMIVSYVSIVLFYSEQISPGQFEVVQAVGGNYGLIAGLLSVVGFIVRYRRSSPAQRRQMNWLLYGACMGLGIMVLLPLLRVVVGLPEARMNQIENVTSSLVLLSLPVVMAVAILRHRVYDIDLVINRTLVYGSVTVVLAAVYAGGVVGVPQLLGLGQRNSLSVAASTLLVAALFNPLRHRVQDFVDRRFYRVRYDTRMTVDAFSSRVQETGDLDQIREMLEDVVIETMQPETVGVWVKPDGD